MLDITSFGVKSPDWKVVWFKYRAKQFGNGLLWRVVILQEEFVSMAKDYANTLTFSHSIGMDSRATHLKCVCPRMSRYACY